MFFNYFTSCGNINIPCIHIHNDCLCLSNRLNLYYCHIFPMKRFLHLNKLWTIYHFMSIQTTDVTMHMKMSFMFFDLVVLPLWLPLWFFFFFFYMSPHCHPTICAMLVSLPYVTLCFCWCYLFGTLWY
jgi:hypothetical protein